MAFKNRLLLFCMCLVFLGGCEGSMPEVIIHTSAGTVVKVRVEIAATSPQRNLGLMYRRQLPRETGMLFMFDREKKQKFTMRNTFVPLDMIFISREKRIVGWVENTTPMKAGPFQVDRPSSYVLEVNAFFCRENVVSEGDRVSFNNFPYSLQRR